MTHYRVPLFESLAKEFATRGFDLIVAYGDPTPEERKKKDSGDLVWGRRLRTLYLLGGRLCWQPFGKLLRTADLVIMTAENKLLFNLVVQFGPCHAEACLWGHGANLQGDPHSLRERFKRIVARRADWWFAYTDLSVPLVMRSGFPRNRITVLNNTVDTDGTAAMRRKVTPQSSRTWLARLGLHGAHVGIFIGSIYAEKRIEFMLDAVRRIRVLVPDFEFLVIGAGPQQHLVDAFCQDHTWARHLGILRGQDKIDVLSLAQVMVNPGLVGLGILDSFVCGVPLTTTDCGLHSPEIAYLSSGDNGLMTADDVEIYATATADLLVSQPLLQRLRAGCAESASRYSLANMAKNFVDGVAECLRSRERAS